MQTGAGGPLPSLTAPASSKKVFVTSTSHDGNLGGVAGGDAICQAAALAASIPNASKFKAWLSDGSNNAIDRLTLPAGPWYRLDGVKVADDKASLTTAPIFSAITQDENGVYTVDYNVWTGTDDGGIKHADRCVDWTSNAGSPTQGHIGSSGTADLRWTNFSYDYCNNPNPIFCFEDN
jgi:hypothetical protein